MDGIPYERKEVRYFCILHNAEILNNNAKISSNNSSGVSNGF
jgi:hypothetical protein